MNNISLIKNWIFFLHGSLVLWTGKVIEICSIKYRNFNHLSCFSLSFAKWNGAISPSKVRKTTKKLQSGKNLWTQINAMEVYCLIKISGMDVSSLIISLPRSLPVLTSPSGATKTGRKVLITCALGTPSNSRSILTKSWQSFRRNRTFWQSQTCDTQGWNKHGCEQESYALDVLLVK